MPWCFIVSFFINLQVRTGDVVVAAVGVPEMVKVSGSTHDKLLKKKYILKIHLYTTLLHGYLYKWSNILFNNLNFYWQLI